MGGFHTGVPACTGDSVHNVVGIGVDMVVVDSEVGIVVVVGSFEVVVGKVAMESALEAACVEVLRLAQIRVGIELAVVVRFPLAYLPMGPKHSVVLHSGSVGYCGCPSQAVDLGFSVHCRWWYQLLTRNRAIE